MLLLKERIDLLSRLGEYLLSDDPTLSEIIDSAYYHNAWFTRENTSKALSNLANYFLKKEVLTKWVQEYQLPQEIANKRIGIIMAGNIPMVGFHDLLCVFISGHHAKIKFSDKDKILIPFLIDKLSHMDSRVSSFFESVDRLTDFDAVIATGSNNSARYFDYYFSKYPHIIRKHRNGIAVLDGSETVDDFRKLSTDIFDYFGLGCRNVSKLYVPAGYDFTPLLEVLHEKNELIHHSKYKNNFDYNIALFLLNQEKYLNNGCIILRPQEHKSSRIASLNYEHYDDLKVLRTKLVTERDDIQCIATNQEWVDLPVIPYGMTQQPRVNDYADDVDTIDFLKTVS